MNSPQFGQELLLEPLKLLVRLHEGEEAAPASHHLGGKSLVAAFALAGRPYEYNVVALRKGVQPLGH